LTVKWPRSANIASAPTITTGNESAVIVNSVRLELPSGGMENKNYIKRLVGAGVKEVPVMHKTQPPRADHAFMPFISKK
jgi:hypothetical protein